ncbi:NAD-dependent epimerase/dehydratase family protein [Lentzea sp. NPDC092896]|uniref:NAD-dependent epimerase/dehydratase family protein n=1 Tax=Lentzea sp. NPDC092896 TaxID=3364127 RepID=UPI003827F86A
MKTIVVGGSGYIGRHVVDALLRDGHEVSILGRNRPDDLPDGVTFHQGDASTMLRSHWAPVLEGLKALVFAAGVDSRAQAPRPSAPFFHRHNVEAVSRMMDAARYAGITSAVIHGSYNVTLNRQQPALKLPERHPYIASRVNQAIEAHDAAGPDCSVAVLEIPYVFGATPNRPSQFAYMVPWLSGNTRLPLMAPPGGTAVVSASAIGVATRTALTTRLVGKFPVAQANLTWVELVSRLARFAGHPDPDNVRHLPAPAIRALMRYNGFLDCLRGVDTGLNYKYYARLYTSEMFVQACVPELKIDDTDLDSALAETVSQKAQA